MYYYMKHPNQGFIKGVKEEAVEVITELKEKGWFRCQDRNDSTPYKAPSKKTSKKSK